ncbi:hypothetical protein GCM10018781_76370 [Kitasatospora indigofera]|uniref:Ricin B lectin domain-containing protein n=1 Tax=Kitasatospora indigofera TaxID=67307 RepID=A0A919DA23_9ACTN|nr:RICIN domain-containing protein [Kitasatospora indigofera]GHE25229.1 hypothetical protein GCM10018781_76370 [Kitasatospora indigofera]
MLRHARKLAGFAALATVALTVPMSASPAEAASGWNSLSRFTIRSAATGKCLEVADWSTARGAAIRQWDCHGGANQKWTYVPVNGRTWDVQIRNVNSGMCIDIPYASNANGVGLMQYPCKTGVTSTADQNQFFHRAQAYGSQRSEVRLETWTSGFYKAIDIPGWNTANGVRAIQYDVNGGANQIFYDGGQGWN